MRGPRVFLTFKMMAIVALMLGLAPASPAVAATNRMCRGLFVSEPLVSTSKKTSQKLRKTFVEFEGRSIYYEAISAAPGRPTAFVFLGLFTPMSDLQKFQASFQKQSRGEGLVIFSYSTSTESLIYGSIMKSPNFSKNEGVDLGDYVRQATAVVNAEGIRGPVSVVGYSYGSAPAARFASFHRERVSNLIFASPLVYPGEHSPQLIVGKEIAESFAAMNPFFGSKMIDGLRARAAEDTAGKIVSDFEARGRFPEFLPSEVVVRSLTAQIRATEEFDLRKEDFSQWPTTHFLLAGKEAPSRLSAQQEVIRQLRSSELGLVESIDGGAHAIMADRPDASAAMVLRVLRSGD